MFITKSLKEVNDKYDRMIAELEKERQMEIERIKEEEKKALGFSKMNVKELKYLSYQFYLPISRGTRKAGMVENLEKRVYEEKLLCIPKDNFDYILGFLDNKTLGNMNASCKTLKKRTKERVLTEKEREERKKYVTNFIGNLHICSNCHDSVVRDDNKMNKVSEVMEEYRKIKGFELYKSKVVLIVKAYLGIMDGIHNKQDKINKAVTLMRFVSNVPEFMKKHKNFCDTVLAKIDEFERRDREEFGDRWELMEESKRKIMLYKS